MRLAAAFAPIPAKLEVAPEEGARADLYALIGALFFSPPDSNLLLAIARSEAFEHASGSALGTAWRGLQTAAAGADPDAVRNEFEQAFVSAGVPRIPLLGTYYMAKTGDQGPMVQLLTDLSGLGIAKRKAVAETEDHLSALCDVMRLLIAGNGARSPQPIDVQQAFFTQQLAPWYGALSAAIRAAGDLRFYGAVAACMEQFFDLERQSFDIDG